MTPSFSIFKPDFSWFQLILTPLSSLCLYLCSLLLGCVQNESYSEQGLFLLCSQQSLLIFAPQLALQGLGHWSPFPQVFQVWEQQHSVSLFKWYHPPCFHMTLPNYFRGSFFLSFFSTHFSYCVSLAEVRNPRLTYFYPHGWSQQLLFSFCNVNIGLTT